MRISLLIKREPFGDVISATLSRFFSERFGFYCSVKWQARNWGQNGRTGHQTWFCNPFVNAIFHPDVRQDAFEPVVNEFSTSTRKWLTPIQRAYVGAASRKPLHKWLASYQLIISPAIPNPDRYMIVGGNHHIRMLDVAKKQCYVICKNGFDKNLLKQDAQIRSSHSFLPSPKICESDLDAGWYCEELIFGTPINRITERKQISAALETAKSALEKLYEKTSQSILLGTYFNELRQRIYLGLETIEILSSAEKQKIIELINGSERLLGPQRKMDIITVQSHGDFQPANILAAKELSWLIDWEYTRRRQADYDGLVYALYARFPGGLCVRMKNALALDLKKENPLSRNELSEWGDKSKRKVILLIFLMEELELRLIEHSSPMIRTVNMAFMTFIKEAEKFISSLVSRI